MSDDWKRPKFGKNAVLRPGDIFEVTDKTHESFGEKYAVVKTVGAGYLLKDLDAQTDESDASLISAMPGGDKKSGIPQYEILRVPSIRGMRPNKIKRYLSEHQKWVSGAGLKEGPLDDVAGALYYDLPTAFDGDDTGKVYLAMDAQRHCRVLCGDFDLSKLLKGEIDSEGELTPKQESEMNDIFRRYKLVQEKDSQEYRAVMDFGIRNGKSREFPTIQQAHLRVAQVFDDWAVH